MSDQPTHEQFATWLDIEMAARGLTKSSLAREVWGSVDDPRGYKVAKNRDRIGVFLSGTGYPSLDTKYKLAEAFGVGWIDDIPGPGKPSRAVSHAKRQTPRVSLATLNQKLDRILAILDHPAQRPGALETVKLDGD